MIYESAAGGCLTTGEYEMRPRCSVIIPTYNAARFVCEALDSINSQTLSPIEIIVVDDGSTDMTADLVQDKYPNVHLIKKNHAGAAVARNIGISAAAGEFIAFLDADDICLPKRLELQLGYLVEYPERSMVFCAMSYVDERGKSVGEKVSCPEYQKEAFLGLLMERNRIGSTSVVVVRKSIMEEFGGFDSAISHCEDYDLWLRVATKYSIGYLDDDLVSYRLHKSNISNNSVMQKKNEIAALRKHSLTSIHKAISQVYSMPRQTELAYAQILLKMGLRTEAFSCLETMPDEKYQEPQFFFLCSLIYLFDNKIYQAEENLLALLKIDSKFAPGINNLGVIYAQKGLLESARKCFHLAVQMTPHYADPRYNLQAIESGDYVARLKITTACLRKVLKPDLSL